MRRAARAEGSEPARAKRVVRASASKGEEFRRTHSLGHNHHPPPFLPSASLRLAQSWERLPLELR